MISLLFLNVAEFFFFVWLQCVVEKAMNSSVCVHAGGHKTLDDAIIINLFWSLGFTTVFVLLHKDTSWNTDCKNGKSMSCRELSATQPTSLSLAFNLDSQLPW